MIYNGSSGWHWAYTSPFGLLLNCICQNWKTRRKASVKRSVANELRKLGGVSFERAGLNGEIEGLSTVLYAQGVMCKTGLSSDLVVDHLRRNFPECGIETESDLVAVLAEADYALYGDPCIPKEWAELGCCAPPLRLIIKRRMRYDGKGGRGYYSTETLECGHDMEFEKGNIYFPTNSRRCKVCWELENEEVYEGVLDEA